MTTRFLRAAACALSLAATAALAQQTNDASVPPAAAKKQASEVAQGDPARWFKDDGTDEERMRTLQKEIGAAYAEAKAACRALAAAERAACLKQAQDTWQADLANARKQLDTTPQLGVRPRR